MPPKVKPIVVALAGEPVSLVDEKPATKARPRKPTKARLTKLETDILSLPPEDQEEVLQRITNQRALLALAQQKGSSSDGGLTSTLEELELDQLRYELGDLLQRQVELRLKEKKVKAAIVKKQRQIILAHQNTPMPPARGTEEYPHDVDINDHREDAAANAAALFPRSAAVDDAHQTSYEGHRRVSNSSLWSLSQRIDLESTKSQRVDISRDCILVSADDIEANGHPSRSVVDVDNDELQAAVESARDNAAIVPTATVEVVEAVSEAGDSSRMQLWVRQMLADVVAGRDVGGGGGTSYEAGTTRPVAHRLSWQATRERLQRMIGEEGTVVVESSGSSDLRTAWSSAQAVLTADVDAVFRHLDDPSLGDGSAPSTHAAWQGVRQAALQLWLRQQVRWFVASSSQGHSAVDTGASPGGPVAPTVAPEAESATNSSTAAVAAAVGDGSTLLAPSPPVIDLFSDDVQSHSEPPRKKQAVGPGPRPPLSTVGVTSSTAATCIIDLASPALQRTVQTASTSAAGEATTAPPSPSHDDVIRTTPLFERLKKISGRQLRRPPTIPEATASSSWTRPMVIDDAEDSDAVQQPPPNAAAATGAAVAPPTTAAHGVSATHVLPSPQRLDRLCQDYGLTALRKQPSLLRNVVSRLVAPPGATVSAAAPGEAPSRHTDTAGTSRAAPSTAATTEATPFEQRSMQAIASFLQHPSQHAMLQRIVTFDVIDVDEVITAARVFWYQHRPVPSDAPAVDEAAAAATATAPAAVTLPDDWLQFFTVELVRQALDAMCVFYKMGALNAKRQHKKRKAKSSSSAV